MRLCRALRASCGSMLSHGQASQLTRRTPKNIHSATALHRAAASSIKTQPRHGMHLSDQRKGWMRIQAAGVKFAVSAASPLGTKRRVRHILLPPGNSELVADLQEQLENGARFEELAKEHSKCISADRGGDLNWVKPGMGLPAVLEEAIFDADVNEIVTADSQHGVHILQVLEEREEAQLQSMDVTELEQVLSKGPDAAQFIDVREPGEHAIAHLPHFELLPLSRMSAWGPELHEKYDKDKETICLCHAGMRSRHFANMLLEQGFTKVFNVVGGIEAYSCVVDEKVPRY